MISGFKNVRKKLVQEEIDIYEFLDRIITPSTRIKRLIEAARTNHQLGFLEEYRDLKLLVPCYSLNFSFDRVNGNRNIKGPSGFIYLDADNCDSIDKTNPYIFACWRSLSKTGYGILVKVKGLSLSNFKSTYTEVSKELNIETDPRAAKASQYTIQSYDEDLYINEDSLTWVAKETSEKKGQSITYSLGRKEDDTECPLFNNVRYDNLDMYDFDGKQYIFFPDEKEMTAKLWIPEIIKEGSRNDILSSIAHQFRALNPTLPYNEFERFVFNVNSSRCNPLLEKDEVKMIAEKYKKTDELKPILNHPRRIIYNEEFNFSAKEKRSILNKLNGERLRQETKKKIDDALKNWDRKIHGKLTQKNLAKVCGLSSKTIRRYISLKELKEYSE